MPDPFSWSIALPYYAIALLFGYLLGSIPFGLLLTKFSGYGDVRKIGSGNIGATNVLRTGNKKLAVLTLLGDGLKGTIAVLIAANYGLDTAIISGLGAFLGHCFPIWLGFKGGKGVATYVGIILGLYWPGMLVFAVVWLAVAFASKYSSLAAFTASFVLTIFLYLQGQTQIAELFILLTAIMLWRHRQNIQRLIAGTEGKVSFASETKKQ